MEQRAARGNVGVWTTLRTRGGFGLRGDAEGVRCGPDRGSGCGSGAGCSLPSPQNVPLGSHPAAAFAVSADAGRLGFVAQRRLGVTQARRWGRGAQSFPLVTPSPSSAAACAARPLRSPPFPPPPRSGVEPRPHSSPIPSHGHQGGVGASAPQQPHPHPLCPAADPQMLPRGDAAPYVPPPPHHTG